MRIAVAAMVVGAGVAHASPDSIAVDASEDIGLLSATHTEVVGGFEHRWWDGRAFVEARVGVGTGDALRWVEERVGAGLVFHPGKRVDFLLGWRVGDTYARGKIGDAAYSVNLLAADLVPRLSVEMWGGWRLRATPLAPTVYWHQVYSGALALELGVEHAL